MAVPPRQFAPRTQNQIKDVRNSAIEHRKQRTTALLKIIEEDLPVLEEEGRSAMARLLQNDGVHHRHVPGYLDFAQLLGTYRDALNVGRFDIETAVALVGIGEAAREEVMRFIQRRQPTDSTEVHRIADNWRERRKSDDESHYRDALRILAEKRIRTLRTDGLAFRRLAAKLHDLLLCYGDKSPEEKAVVRLEVIEKAAELRIRFQNEYGNDATPVEDWGDISDPAERLLAEADHALKVLANGEFVEELPSIVPGRDFRTPLFELGKYLGRWSAIDSVGFLARRPRRTSTRYAKRPLARLSAVDICAGIGSGVLGLKSSGFFPSRIFDGNKANVDSFLANRRTWRVRHLDINDAEAVAAEMKLVAQSNRGKQLDLIMGSLPKKPWRIKGPGVNYDDELHSAAMTMVRDFKPRAFFFEQGEGLTTEKHAEFYLPMTTFFAEQGYHTAVFALNHVEFGIPQERTSTYLVGVERRYADKLRHPIVRKPVTPTVAQLIEKIAFPYRTVEGYGDIKGEQTPQLIYNNWSSEWLRTHGQKPTKDVSGAYTKNMKTYWADHGFQLFPKTDDPCAVGKHPKQMLIPMTTSVIKALQGLPREWIVSGKTIHDKMSALCLATPPVITAAVARSVHAALTGDQIDLDSADALKISTSPFLHHPYYVDDMGNSKQQLAALWRTGILRMRGELPVGMEDDDPDLRVPPEEYQLGQGKIMFKKRPS